MYPYYAAEIAALPADGQRFAVFDWGGFVVGHGVLYDESDEIASGHPSEVWWSKAKGHGVTGYGRSAFGHFYFVVVE